MQVYLICGSNFYDPDSLPKIAAHKIMINAENLSAGKEF